MHWLLGQAISTKVIILVDHTDPSNPWEQSQYNVCSSQLAQGVRNENADIKIHNRLFMLPMRYGS